jgi:GT2 family glycosyltransferase
VRDCYVAGIINHGAYDDVERCLASLRAQTCPPRAVYVVDTGVSPVRFAALRDAHADVVFETRENRGWGAGVNRILARTDAEQAAADFVLLLNPDIELDPDFAEVLVAAMDAAPDVALASGKLLRPGRAQIDSAGIVLPRHRRPRDRASGEPERHQYDGTERIFGVSGAAMFVRRAALPDLTVAGEVVDESFFAYHDDTDLCWRAGRLGWSVLYEPRARAVHARGWRAERRLSIDPQVRRNSFRNHYLQVIKNERAADLLRNLPWLLGWEVLRLGFVLLRDRAMLPAYLDAIRQAPRAFARRRAIAGRVRERSARAASRGS